MKISDLHREFKNYALAERGMTPQYVKDALRILQKFCQYAKTEHLGELNTTVLRGFFYEGRGAKGWSVKTFHNYWQYLKTFFDWCIKKQYLQKNPVTEIEKPKLKKCLPRFLSHEDSKKILYHVAWYPWRYGMEKQRNEAIIATLLMTGLRLQELLNLEATDVNLQNSTIFVREGKGKKDRIVPVHPQLLPILRGYFNERKRLNKPSQWFFTGVKSDKKLSQKNVRAVCRKISVASGIKFTPHMLRHTFAREMVDNDFNLYKLKEIMGHSQITTTQIYLSVSTEGIKRSFDMVKIF